MISIIIVGYNSRADLPDCLDSIYKSSHKNFEIIFVDNDSTDDSLEFVRKNYPKVITIKNKNTGYAGGNNVGIKKALESNNDYVFLLNPDTIIDKECLDSLVRKSNQNTILQPLVLLNINDKNTNLINTTGGCLNFLGFSYCSDYRKKKTEVSEKDIAIASGAASFIPVAIINKIGLFDQSFFMYHEDVDFSWRARKNGFNIRLIPESLVWHKYSFSRNAIKMFYADRNRLLFLHKNLSLKYRMLIFPAFVVNEVLMIFYSLLTGWFWTKLKSYASYSKLATNRNKPNMNTVSESILKKYLTPQLSFSELASPLFAPYNFLLKLYWWLIAWAI